MSERGQLEGWGLKLGCDLERGVVRSLRLGGDVLGTEYVGHEENVSDTSFLTDPSWLGDVLIRLWDGGAWRKETTGRSADVCTTRLDPAKRRFEVCYEGRSEHPEGLSAVAVRQSFEIQADGLFWEVELTNRSDRLLELGEVAFPFVMNTDFAEYFRGGSRLATAAERQQAWHERKVMMHACIIGHGSYVVLQRPLGDQPCLLFHTVGDTSLEAMYKFGHAEGYQWDVVWEGPSLLAAHSWACRQVYGWQEPREQQRHWINGHTYLLLAPKAGRTFRFRFAAVRGHADIARDLRRYGGLHARVHPGLVVPFDQPVSVQLGCDDTPVLTAVGERVDITPEAGDGADHRYTMRFHTRGQKKVRVTYGDGRSSTLLFYTLPPLGQLLEARARFIMERQLLDNPDDPCGRHHAFLPYDTMLEAPFTESDVGWMIGGSDEYCLPVGMFLAEKNVHKPNEAQIAALESYVDDFLFGKLQDRDTFAVRRGMCWFDDHPSRERMNWDQHTAESTSRSFNYPLVANVYHAMFRIGRLHRLLRRRTPEQYLDMCWRTAMKWLETGPQAHIGAPAGSNVVEILADLEREDHAKHATLRNALLGVAERMRDEPYPLGSELYVDQTAHDQVHALMERFGFQEEARRTLQITKALRAGAQPVWFWYGNEKRGNVSCWYAQTLNARALFSGYDALGDPEMLAWGHGGLTSFLTTLLSDGAARGWFLWWPDRMGFDSRSLDTDLGAYGYLRAAKAYVVEDDTFGLTGYGCRVTVTGSGCWCVEPWDGLRKRLAVRSLGIDVLVQKGELVRATIDRATPSLALELEDPTGHVSEAVLSIRGADGRRLQEANDGELEIRVDPDTGAVRLKASMARAGRLEVPLPDKG